MRMFSKALPMFSIATHCAPSLLFTGLAMIIKQRVKAGSIERMDLVGSVDDSDVIIVDDMIDTAGTLCAAAEQLKANGGRPHDHLGFAVPPRPLGPSKSTPGHAAWHVYQADNRLSASSHFSAMVRLPCPACCNSPPRVRLRLARPVFRPSPRAHLALIAGRSGGCQHTPTFGKDAHQRQDPAVVSRGAFGKCHCPYPAETVCL